MKVIIDRFEGDYAICEKEDQTMIDLERKKIPKNTKSGDALRVNEDGSISLDEKETDKRKKRIETLMEDMWE